MKKKLLTVEDLVLFCQEQKLYSFSAKDTGYQLCVQIPATFKKQEEKDDSTLLFATVKAFHTGRNRNHSNVTIDAAKKAMKTMAYKPILANFMTDEDGNMDFTSHDMELDDNGNLIYLEHQIGCFTADAPYLEQDPDNEDRQYVMATCAIPKEYTAAADIIKRKNGTKVSVELAVNEMSYDSKHKELMFTDIEVSGLTCLGIDPETGESVEEGMEGARLDIADFSVEKNSVKFELDENIKKFIQASIKEAFDNMTNLGKEETETMDLEKNVEVTETSEEDVIVEKAMAEDEVVEETETKESTEEVTVTEEQSEDATDEVAPSEDEEKLDDNFATLTVTVNGETKTFSASLVEKLNALDMLINSTYGESDNDWYTVDADEDAREVYAHGVWGNKHFKQKYSVKKDVYTLQGDRVDVFAKYLTQDEINQLDQMKANYAEISDKLAKYEAEPEKMAILESEDYSSISENDEFVALKAQDAHFDLSVEDVRKKADEILLAAAKAGSVDFAAKSDEKKEIAMKKIPTAAPKKAGRYGGIFSKN